MRRFAADLVTGVSPLGDDALKPDLSACNLAERRNAEDILSPAKEQLLFFISENFGLSDLIRHSSDCQLQNAERDNERLSSQGRLSKASEKANT